MAITTSQAAAIEDALVTQLQARVALSGVQVSSGPLGNDTAQLESMQCFGAAPATQVPGSTGNKRMEETVILSWQVFVEQPGGGTSVLRATRDRAYALVAEVEQQLRTDTHVNNTCMWAYVSSIREDRGLSPDAGGRRSILTFETTHGTSLPTV